MIPAVPIPSGSTWELYPALAILVLVILVLVGLTIGVWREYKTWAREKEDRETQERESQRKWQAEQDEKRDHAWQGTVLELQKRHSLDGEKDRDALAKLAEVIDRLVLTVDGLRNDFSDHVIEDAARFNVLFSDAQKGQMPAEIHAVKIRKARRNDDGARDGKA